MSVSSRFHRWRASLRLRAAAGATLLAALTFTAGGAVALVLYHDNLVSGVEHDALGTAHTIAKGAAGGSIPNPIPMPTSAGVPRVQILDAAGNVISGDPDSAEDPAFVAPVIPGGQRLTGITGTAFLPEHHAEVAALGTLSAGRPITVVVATSLDDAGSKTNSALKLSAAIGAGCLALVAGVAWFSVGRTLRRVERLRRRVAAAGGGSPAVSGDELARLGTTLDEMLAVVERSSARQRRFVTDAAHELRTPLAGLSASIDVAVNHPTTARDPEWITELRDGHRRLGRLVGDLLVLASLDEHAPRHRQPIDLAGIITDATRRGTATGVSLRAGRVEPASVMGDEAQLERIVTNLVDNALRHARTSVEIGLAVDGRSAVVSISDDGPGVPAGDRERIWDRFVRLDDDRGRVDGGTGLGLALVKELVAAHGGSASVEDAAAGGARFVVRLPLADG